MKVSYYSRLSPEHISILEEFTKDVPVKVGALAKALGLKVVVAALPLKISGLIKPDPDGGFVIKVNRFEPKERQRFTIAHEIAHFLLHRDKIQAGVVDSVLYRSKLSSRVEAEANRLAADIIMPLDKVSELSAVYRTQGDHQIIATLAETFQVSRQAMEIRTGD
ncbi:ImmA/IrrE family metallo-endopeptidase [Sphingosinicella ginsenosidimutans]|uniref:ImmA/IrrE family metallo-endopeptidase n=1 Tax=Allosphingosinicella ginsenosidimutans TaxID=1176539 RepID=A0A5C6TRU1_9SPHN|nr:ImmA/IrrE family metallo-endopeptidase [Sphingosinicella ginsenosidimutans]TXC62919.1 ImmA/IrrE family metallo-endopeptidase [Sphingosinicella ginsenosidimutans]